MSRSHAAWPTYRGNSSRRVKECRAGGSQSLRGYCACLGQRPGPGWRQRRVLFSPAPRLQGNFAPQRRTGQTAPLHYLSQVPYLTGSGSQPPRAERALAGQLAPLPLPALDSTLEGHPWLSSLSAPSVPSTGASVGQWMHFFMRGDLKRVNTTHHPFLPPARQPTEISSILNPYSTFVLYACAELLRRKK